MARPSNLVNHCSECERVEFPQKMADPASPRLRDILPLTALSDRQSRNSPDHRVLRSRVTKRRVAPTVRRASDMTGEKRLCLELESQTRPYVHRGSRVFSPFLQPGGGQHNPKHQVIASPRL